MWYKIKEFFDLLTLVFFLFLLYLTELWEKVVKRFKKKKEYYPYGVEVIEARNKELSDEIQKVADKHGVSFDVANDISHEINRAHKRIRTKILFD